MNLHTEINLHQHAIRFHDQSHLFTSQKHRKKVILNINHLWNVLFTIPFSFISFSFQTKGYHSECEEKGHGN